MAGTRPAELRAGFAGAPKTISLPICKRVTTWSRLAALIPKPAVCASLTTATSCGTPVIRRKRAQSVTASFLPLEIV
jgi:hypothetical protein